MTEKKYIKIFVQQFYRIWLVAVVAGLILGFIAAARLKPSYEGSVTLSLTKPTSLDQANTPFYLYDGYYSEQAAVTAKTGLVSWLKAPKTVSDVYQNAGLPLGNKSAASLARTFKLDDTSTSNTVALTASAGNEADTTKLMQALVAYIKQSYKMTQATVVTSDPVILAVNPAKNLVILAIMLAVTGVVFFITLVTHYFRDEN